MKQSVKLFSAYTTSIDTDINNFLKKHPEYSIDKITFASGSSDRALVVFNVKEPPTARVPEFENATSIADCKGCKIREFCKDFGDGGVHTCQEVYQIYLQSKENK